MYEKQNDRKECTYPTVSGLLLNPARASYSGDPVKVRTPNTIYVLHYLFEARYRQLPDRFDSTFVKTRYPAQ